jgi:hypothetical protein
MWTTQSGHVAVRGRSVRDMFHAMMMVVTTASFEGFTRSSTNNERRESPCHVPHQRCRVDWGRWANSLQSVSRPHIRLMHHRTDIVTRHPGSTPVAVVPGDSRRQNEQTSEAENGALAETNAYRTKGELTWYSRTSLSISLEYVCVCTRPSPGAPVQAIAA